MRKIASSLLVVCTAAFGGSAWAQQAPLQYGSPEVNLEQAKKAVAAAEAEARKNGWAVVIAVVSNGGYLVHFSRMDQTPFISVAIAQQKARTAAIYRRPTKAYQDALQANPPNLAILTLENMIASDGGIPLMMDGKVIGAIGCSGAAPAQDAQACQAGADALK